MKHRVLICHLCTPSKKFQNIGGLVKHYLAHSIGKQQCKYCLYACTYPEEMFLHYSKSHQTQFPIAILRSIPKVSIIPSEITVNCLELVDLDWIYKDSIHQPITFNDYIKQKGLENTPDTEVDTDIDVENDIADDVEEVNIQNEIETINLIYDDAIESEKQLESQNEPLITVKHRTKELESEIVNAIDPLNIDPLENIDLNQSEMESVSEVTAESVSNNPDFELFRCGTTDCNFVTDTAQKFKAHLSSCDVSKEEGYFKCIHCTKKFKYSTTLTEHIQIHGTLRYICSICDHRAPFEYLIHKHMKIKHKIHTCKLVPNNDLFIAVPNYKSAPKNQAKTAFESTEEKFSYEPEELEKLPRMAIYSQDRKCARCGYSSKVRTNLFRHLQAHLNDAPVPESAPVNPVPCLEKNEKMFDKMLNLANSSFPGGRMGGKNEKSSVNDSTVPSFVPVSKRFVCGAEGCNYLTHDDSMLKYHFNALHSDDTTYKCPHCRLELSNEMGEVNIDHVVFHLRMHDLHLYKCLLCEYIHYQKHKVEKHITDKHPNKMPYIHVIRELDNSANVEGDQRNTEITITETHKETKEEKFWKCGFCRYRSLSENDIKVHVAQSHGIESQYKCSLCSFQCDTPTDFPLHATTHPNLDGLLLSIYYQCENTAEKSTVTHSEVDSFDTTPLWRRGTAKVKNIRGILIEETRSPKKTPKSQEKTAKINLKCYETISKNLFGEDDLDEPDSKQAMDLIKSFGDFGGPVDNKFSCPFCKEYQTLFKRKFVSHIFKELNYNR